jgi:hypothetical protein
MTGLSSVMITPAAFGVWALDPAGGLVSGVAVLLITAGLWLGMSPALPPLVRVAAATVGFGFVALVTAVSSVFWLAFPFSLAMLPVVAVFGPCGVVVTVAWWLLLGRPLSDVAAANRRLMRTIGLCALVGLAADGAMYAVFASRTRSVVHQMSWKPGGSPVPKCGARVLLLDERCTALTREVCSDEVARYLESIGDVTVPVTYSITDDFGKVWSYTIRSIGPLRVDLESGESVKKLDDVGCIFLP